jgi:hypothetical protein
LPSTRQNSLSLDYVRGEKLVNKHLSLERQSVGRAKPTSRNLNSLI